MASLGQHGPGSAVDLVCINVRDLVGVVGICATPFRCFLGTAWSLHGGNFAGGDGMCARVLRYLFFGTLHHVLPVLHDVLPVLHARCLGRG
jgi:hypothetical protein